MLILSLNLECWKYTELQRKFQPTTQLLDFTPSRDVHSYIFVQQERMRLSLITLLPHTNTHVQIYVHISHSREQMVAVKSTKVPWRGSCFLVRHRFRMSRIGGGIVKRKRPTTNISWKETGKEREKRRKVNSWGKCMERERKRVKN